MVSSWRLVDNAEDRARLAVLFRCGISESFLAERSRELRSFFYGGDYRSPSENPNNFSRNPSSDTFWAGASRRCDVNELLVLYRGLIISETFVVKGLHSATPTRIIFNQLRSRLPGPLFEAVADWTATQHIDAVKNGRNVNPYAPRCARSTYIQGGESKISCVSCIMMESLDPMVASMSADKFQQWKLEVATKKYNSENKCPICRDGILHLRNTRWGNVMVCSNYPECRPTTSP